MAARRGRHAFWHSYHPNTESLDRYSWQFQFERKWWPNRIPNWTWGHALDIGLLRKEDVPTHIPKDFDWPKLQSAWSQGKAHGSTASVVTKVATEDCQTVSSSGTPNAGTEDGLSVSTKCVTFALGPEENRNNNNETGQDKDPKSDKANAPNSNTETADKQSRVVRRILSQWKKVRRSHPRAAIRIPSQ